MEIHKPREKEKGISERGDNNARMGRVLHETAGRNKGRKKGRNTNEREADGATAPAETEITVEKVERQIRKLKKRKAPERDEAQNEAWMYGTEGIVGRLVEPMKGVWRGEGFPID
jgi:hypothetical protein